MLIKGSSSYALEPSAVVAFFMFRQIWLCHCNLKQVTRRQRQRQQIETEIKVHKLPVYFTNQLNPLQFNEQKQTSRQDKKEETSKLERPSYMLYLTLTSLVSTTKVNYLQHSRVRLKTEKEAPKRSFFCNEQHVYMFVCVRNFHTFIETLQQVNLFLSNLNLSLSECVFIVCSCSYLLLFEQVVPLASRKPNTTTIVNYRK